MSEAASAVTRTRGPSTVVSRSRAVVASSPVASVSVWTTDHAGLIDAKVELPPATPAAATVFRGRPLTCPDDGQTRAVEHEMDGLAGRDQSQTAPQMPTAPGERRIVWGGEVEAHHPEQRVQEPFGLA